MRRLHSSIGRTWSTVPCEMKTGGLPTGGRSTTKPRREAQHRAEQISVRQPERKRAGSAVRETGHGDARDRSSGVQTFAPSFGYKPRIRTAGPGNDIPRSARRCRRRKQESVLIGKRLPDSEMPRVASLDAPCSDKTKGAFSNFADDFRNIKQRIALGAKPERMQPRRNRDGAAPGCAEGGRAVRRCRAAHREESARKVAITPDYRPARSNFRRVTAFPYMSKYLIGKRRCAPANSGPAAERRSVRAVPCRP